MKILFLLLAMPDLGKTSNMYSDLVLEFARNGHDVYPVAPVPNGDIGTHLSEEKGINVLRVKTNRLFNVGIIRKGIANVLLPGQFQKAINRFWGEIKFDLIIAPTPPITLADTVGRIKYRCGSKSYLVLRDIFPQNAIDMGYLKKWMPMYWNFRRQEKALYRLSDKIGCMSQGNIDYIKNHNPDVSGEKLHILENFQRSEENISKDSSIKSKYGLAGKFVVIFGGNMGAPQKLENVIELARVCATDYSDVVFLLVGKGTERRRIEAMAKNAGATNVIFKDFIPHEDYQQLVAQCDVGLISLSEKFTIPNIPSKTLSYFNLGIPVLASLDSATDYGKILETAGAGLWSIAGDLKTYRANFDRLYKDVELRHRMGECGKRYFAENMTVEIAYRTILKQIGKLP